MNPDPNPSDPETLLREQCLAYLLGELSAQQRREFESQLDSPTVADALAKESELLLNLSRCDALNQDSDLVQPGPADSPATSARSIAVAILVIAATLLLLVANHWDAADPLRQANTEPGGGEQTNTTYDLQLAKIWAEPAVDWGLVDQAASGTTASDTSSTDNTAIEEVSADSETAPDDDTNSDAAFEWMVAAVEATFDEGEEQNDG